MLESMAYQGACNDRGELQFAIIRGGNAVSDVPQNLSRTWEIARKLSMAHLLKLSTGNCPWHHFSPTFDRSGAVTYRLTQADTHLTDPRQTLPTPLVTVT
jgi:hypothetical protein